MNKSEVYSWRISPDLKSALSAEARREGATVSELLDRAVGEFLAARRALDGGTDVEQRRLHEAARRAIGALRGGEPRRSEQVREAVRDRLKRRHGV